MCVCVRERARGSRATPQRRVNKCVQSALRSMECERKQEVQEEEGKKRMRRIVDNKKKKKKYTYKKLNQPRVSNRKLVFHFNMNRI